MKLKGSWPIVTALFAGILITAGCSVFIPESGNHIVAFIYLLYISLSALYLKTWQVLCIAFLSALTWNFLFLSPRFTFAIDRPEDMFMLAMYFVNATLIGSLTSRLRKNEINLIQRSRKLSSLYDLARDLGKEDAPDDIIRSAEKQIGAFFGKKIPMGLEREKAKSDKSYSDEERAFLIGATDLIKIALERHTLLKAAQEAKLNIETERLYGLMLNLVSHELRTPLTTIIGAATSLRDPTVDALEKSRHALYEEILTAGNRLNDLLENLLSMSRIESGHLRLDKHPCTIQDMILSALENIPTQNEEKKIVYTIPDDLPTVTVDFQLMERVFCNIIGNCLTYSRSDSKITIAGIMDGEWACIAISDEGPGFPDAILTAPFVKFRRGQGVLPGGLGLGLSICESIIASHGGTLHLKNRNGGAEYSIRLPLSMRAAEKKKDE